MAGSQAPHDLDKDIPDLFLFDVSLSLLIVADFLKDIAIISILHDETKARR